MLKMTITAQNHINSASKLYHAHQENVEATISTAVVQLSHSVPQECDEEKMRLVRGCHILPLNYNGKTLTQSFRTRVSET